MKKSKYTTILWATACIALAAAAILLLVDRTGAKAFSDIVPNADRFESCQIICVMLDRENEMTITGQELKGLLSLLDHIQYYKQGSYGNIMEGALYHLYFSSPQTGTFPMIVSDLGMVYIGENSYEFGPEIPADSISSYIETLSQ